jgi:hypothetical protein
MLPCGESSRQRELVIAILSGFRYRRLRQQGYLTAVSIQFMAVSHLPRETRLLHPEVACAGVLNPAE